MLNPSPSPVCSRMFLGRGEHIPHYKPGLCQLEPVFGFGPERPNYFHSSPPTGLEWGEVRRGPALGQQPWRPPSLLSLCTLAPAPAGCWDVGEAGAPATPHPGRWASAAWDSFAALASGRESCHPGVFLCCFCDTVLTPPLPPAPCISRLLSSPSEPLTPPDTHCGFVYRPLSRVK